MGARAPRITLYSLPPRGGRTSKVASWGSSWASANPHMSCFKKHWTDGSMLGKLELATGGPFKPQSGAIAVEAPEPTGGEGKLRAYT